MKKKILAITLVVAVMAILAAGTIAYFTDIDNAANRFSFNPGDVPEGDPVDIDLLETFDPEGANDTDPDDVTDDYTAEYTDEGIAYTNVYPGAVVSKIPVVQNVGTTPVYTRVVVAVSKSWNGTLGIDFNTTNWTPVTGDAAAKAPDGADYVLYTYLYNGVLDPTGTTEELFTTVTVPTSVSSADVRDLGKNFGIQMVAQGVQSLGFADAESAFVGAYFENDLTDPIFVF